MHLRHVHVFPSQNTVEIHLPESQEEEGGRRTVKREHRVWNYFMAGRSDADCVKTDSGANLRVENRH